MRRPVIYMAARYSRHEEMAAKAADLARVGYTVAAEWITGAHDGSDDATCALVDMAEVRHCDIVISFAETDPTSRGRNRGGRHVEFGIGLALRKRMVLVDGREHVFHYHPDVEFFATWGEALSQLTKEVSELSIPEPSIWKGRITGRQSDRCAQCDHMRCDHMVRWHCNTRTYDCSWCSKCLQSENDYWHPFKEPKQSVGSPDE